MGAGFPRCSLRALVIGVAVLGVGLWAVRSVIPHLWGLGFADGTYHGPNTNRLGPGRGVVLSEDVRAVPADRVIRATGFVRDDGSRAYSWSGDSSDGEVDVSAGTRGVVTIDPAWDEDSCSPYRPIAVELTEGEHRGKVIAVRRRVLRRS